MQDYYDQECLKSDLLLHFNNYIISYIIPLNYRVKILDVTQFLKVGPNIAGQQ